MANGTIAASQIEMLSQSGAGIITITPPATNTNRALALPDASGTVQVSGNPISGTTASFSGDVTLGSSVLATPSGSAPSYTCRAWVNFNGTGTVAIRASGNVSSITDNGTGIYTANFTTAMPDVNYEANTQATNGTGVAVDDQRCLTSTPSGSYTTASFKVGVLNAANSAFQDASVVNIVIFR